MKKLRLFEKNPNIFVKHDRNGFSSMMDMTTGSYIRTGKLIRTPDDKVIDSGEDVFMAEMPELIDIGVMGHCIHGKTGLCMKSGVQCYQAGSKVQHPNMSVEDFESILMQAGPYMFQTALGGRGDVNKHENFEDLLRICHKYNVVPNYTTSGLDLTMEEVAITKKYCGAVAVSLYDRSEDGYTYNAIKQFVDAGITTNVHYVLGNNSIDEAIERVTNADFPKGISAVIFLLHKPVGLGQENNVLKMDDPKVKAFFNLIDEKAGNLPFKIGFDSCSIPGVLNYTKNIAMRSCDTCEGGRFSCYITSDMKMLPCSFDNQDLFYAVDLRENTVLEAWESEAFNRFRRALQTSCPNCSKRTECMGGCPLQRGIVLCNDNAKELKTYKE